MRFDLFGTLEVYDAGGTLVDLGGPQPRTVLAALLAAEGRVVSADALIDAIWGESPPPSAPGTLQTYVSRLRRALEPDRKPRDAAAVLVSDPQGYRIVFEPDDVDIVRFEALADAGRAALAEGRPAQAATLLREAEGLWKGAAFAEYADAEWARGPATRLEERRLAVFELRLDAELALGLSAEVAAEAAVAVRDEPLREGRWATLALALYRSGRQAEALRALDEARRTLVDELGVEPGRALKELEGSILAQDPALDLVAAATSTSDSDTLAAPSTGADGTTVAPLVGRRAELETLRAALAEAGRSSRFVVVEGEPGIGKTRLLEALGAEAAGRGALVVWGRTHESGAAPAYWPWLAALRALVDARPDVEAALEPLLAPGADAGQGGEAGPASFRLHETVAAALEVVTALTPLVVVLDDLQWADPASLELLGFLATRLGDAPVLVGVTLRPLEAGRSDGVTSALSAIARRPGSRRLILRGLDAEESRELLSRAAGREVPDSVAAAIHARASGNPFFTGELTRLLADEELLADAAAVASAPVPAGVRDVLRRRLDRLPEPTVDVLRVAAVLGRELELSLLAAATDRSVDACLDELEPAVEQGLLVDATDPACAARFAHALVREVLVEDMTSLRRARLHLRAADALAAQGGDDVAELVAEHLWAAVPLGVGERAAEALERAADVAVRRSAFATGEDLLRRALTLRQAAGSTDAQVAAELATLMSLAGVMRSLHGYKAILELVDRGKELARRLGARDLLTNLEWAEWAAADTACDFERSTPLAERFRAMADDCSPDDFVSLMLAHGVWGIHCWHMGRMTDSARSLDVSLAAAAHFPRHDYLLGIVSEQRLLTEVFDVHVHDLVGDLDDPAGAYAQMHRASDDRFARAMIAGFECAASTAIGDFVRAGMAGRAGLAADPDVAFSFWGSMNQMYAAGADLALGGDPEEATALFEEGHARYRRAGTRTALGLLHTSMALGFARRGDLERARLYLGNALDHLRTTGEVWPEPLMVLAEAEILARDGGTPDEVAALTSRAEAMATEQGAHAIARRIATDAAALQDLLAPD